MNRILLRLKALNPLAPEVATANARAELQQAHARVVQASVVSRRVQRLEVQYALQASVAA